MTGVDVFTGAGVENRAVEGAPLFGKALGNGVDLGGFAEVARQYQYLAGEALGQYLQWLFPARAQGQMMAIAQQALGQGVADAAAGAGQPDAFAEGAHASLPFSQRMTEPNTGRCS